MHPGSKRTASGTCSLSYQRLKSASWSGSTVARTLKRYSGNMSTLLRHESHTRELSRRVERCGSAAGHAARGSVELHRPTTEGHVHRRLHGLDEGVGPGAGPNLATVGRLLVHVRDDDGIRLHQLVHDVSGL